MEMKATKQSKKKEVAFITLNQCSPGVKFSEIANVCIKLALCLIFV